MADFRRMSVEAEAQSTAQAAAPVALVQASAAMPGPGAEPRDLPLEDALARLASSQALLTKWLGAVNAKIFELETSYLEETPQGNVVKGWEVDGRPLLPHKSRAIEDKERLFSYSSYAYLLAKKSDDEGAAGASSSVPRGAAATAFKPRKGAPRKRPRQDEDWNAPEDY